MYFVAQYRTRHDAAALRATHHPAHVGFRKNLGGRVLLSGPLLTGDGGEPVGSLFIIAADNLAAAHELAAADPLCIHGVSELISVQPFRPMVYNPPTEA